jgi:hypothetical protein
VTDILDLSKVAAPRPTVRLPHKNDPDGKAYPYAAPSDFGALELHRVVELQAASERLDAVKRPTLKTKSERTRLLGELVKLLVPTIEPHTLKLLPPAAREQIALTWFGHFYADKKGEQPKGEARSRRTTAASSRGSKRSTAVRRSAGSASPAGR